MPATLDIVGRLHRQLLEIVAIALPLIPSSRRDVDLAALGHLRHEMVDAMRRYRRHAEDVHAAAYGSGDPSAIAAADMLCHGSKALGRAYDEFRARWAHREALANWPEYRLSAIRMMKLVRNQVQQAEAARGGEMALAA